MKYQRVKPEDYSTDQIPVSKRTKKMLAIYKANNDYRTYDDIINDLFKGIELPGENHGTA